MSDELDFDLDNILDEDEEEILSPGPIQHNYQDPSTLQELNSYKGKIGELQAEVNKVKDLLSAGKKTNQLEVILQKYSNLDPEFRQMSIELLHANNEMQADVMKPMYEYFDRIQKELDATKQAVSNVTNSIHNVQGSIAFDKMVRIALEKKFAKNRVKVDHVEEAKKAHFKRYEKDEVYALEIIRINESKTLTASQKDRLVGEAMAANFALVQKRKLDKGKTTAADLTPKKNQEKDTTTEKAQKKLDKEIAEAEVPAADSEEAKEEKKRRMLESFRKRQDRL
jgi:hypothetical protein